MPSPELHGDGVDSGGRAMSVTRTNSPPVSRREIMRTSGVNRG